MPRALTVVGLGEALFDLYPDRNVLGGAPLNVGVHAHQLLQPSGGQGVVASSVGSDELGQGVRTELRHRCMTDDYLQTADYPTGTVQVTLDGNGQPSYEIRTGSAWDHLAYSPHWDELASTCGAVCFGTLAQRSEPSRYAVRRFLTIAQQALVLFDVNLRQNFYSAEIIDSILKLSQIAKLNSGELAIVSDLLGLSGEPEALLRSYSLQAVALTRGAQGTTLYTSDGAIPGEPVRYPAQANADAVGAGDACSAGLLAGLLLGFDLPDAVALADHCGAFVASQPGATPRLPSAILAMA